MTSFLGPEIPPPQSLISEIHQRSLRVSKTRNDDDDLFDFGDEYYSQICKLLRLQAGINIDDKLCVISSTKSRVAKEIEQRLCLVYPIFTLSSGIALYEDISGTRNINVGVLNIDAEDFFKKVKDDITFDKVIILDGLELIEDRVSFLGNIRQRLNKKTDGSLIIIHRTKDMLTLPLYLEAIRSFGNNQIEVDNLLTELLKNQFLVGWNIVSLPICLPKEKWFNQLYNHFPPVMENVNVTDIFGGLRDLVDTSFKYSDYIVSIKDRFLFLVATLTENVLHQPYKMHLLDDEIETTSDQSSLFKPINLLRMKVTSDIRGYLPKNLKEISSFIEDDEFPEEWWGTMAVIPTTRFDKSRINRHIQRKYNP